MRKLLPRRIGKLIPSIEKVLNTPEDERTVYLHFYNPVGEGDWYVLGGDRSKRGWLFFGLIFFSKSRTGYFSSEELKNKSIPFGLSIEIEESFTPIPLKELSQAIEKS